MKFTTLPAEILRVIACQVSCKNCPPEYMPETDQLEQVQKKRDLLSLSLVSKAIHEVFSQAYLWRSVSIEICEGSLDSFPSFVPNSAFLNYTRDVHFSSEFVRNIEERCPHFHQHGNDSGEDDVDLGEVDIDQGEDGDDHSEDCIDSIADGCFNILAKGAASVLNQLQPGTLRSLRYCSLYTTQTLFD